MKPEKSKSDFSSNRLKFSVARDGSKGISATLKTGPLENGFCQAIAPRKCFSKGLGCQLKSKKASRYG